jgi:hypothetical protein
VLAARERRQAVLDRRDRRAGALDDDVDRRMRDERAPVVADVRRTGRDRIGDARRARPRVAPADAREVRTRRVGREIRDRGEVDSGVRGICARYIAPNLPAPIGRGSACAGFALLQLCVETPGGY